MCGGVRGPSAHVAQIALDAERMRLEPAPRRETASSGEGACASALTLSALDHPPPWPSTVDLANHAAATPVVTRSAWRPRPRGRAP